MMRVGKRISWIAASVLAVALAGCCDSNTPLGVRTSGGGGPAAVPLGTTSTFGVLAGAGVTNTGATAITGDLGTSPTASVTGFFTVDAGPGTVSGTIHQADATAATAQSDLTVAYNNAAGLTTGVISLSGDLTGLTLAPGLYKSTSSLGITGDLTLNALGNQNAVFVIQMASTLTTGAGSKVILAGGAQASKIIWQVGTSATLGANSVFKGTILANTSISANTGAKVDGRLLARSGAVTLIANAIVAQ